MRTSLLRASWAARMRALFLDSLRFLRSFFRREAALERTSSISSSIFPSSSRDDSLPASEPASSPLPGFSLPAASFSCKSFLTCSRLPCRRRAETQ